MWILVPGGSGLPASSVHSSQYESTVRCVTGVNGGGSFCTGLSAAPTVGLKDMSFPTIVELLLVLTLLLLDDRPQDVIDL